MPHFLETSRPKVSVVVTCYNLGVYLEDALSSIPLEHGGYPIEVIVVDDGSDDAGTIQVLAQLDQVRFKLIRQPNMGLGKARNNGIRVAQGEYIIPLDADNRLRPAMIEETISVLDAEPSMDVVYGDAEYFGDRQGRWVLGEYDLALLTARNRIDACAGFRKGLWERVQGYDEKMPVMGYEDWDFWLRCSMAGARFHYSSLILFDYRIRKGSMYSTTIKHQSALIAYMFNKPELRTLRLPRILYMKELQREQRHPRARLRRLIEHIKGWGAWSTTSTRKPR